MYTQAFSSEIFKCVQQQVNQQFSEAALTDLFPLSTIAMGSSVSPPQLLSTVLDNYLTSSHPVLLLLADAGMGKTVCLQVLIRRLLAEWREGNPIPVYLSLANLKTSFAEWFESFFSNCGFSPDDIKQLKAQHTFIVIADGYDASLGFVPLCQEADDKLLEWQIDKWIISSRTNYFFNSLDFDYRALFAYYQGNQRIEPQVIQLLPLSYAVISKEISLDQACQEYLIKDEGLLALSTNTLMLNLLLKHLPEMMQQPKATAYQLLLTKWIAYQVERLKAHGLIHDSDSETLQKVALWYIVAVALRLHELGETEISLHGEDSFELEDIEVIKTGWQRFLNTKDKLTTLARACCPVQSHSPTQVRLFHQVVIEQVSQLEIELPKDKAQLPVFLNGYEGSEQLALDLNTELRVTDTEHLSAFIGRLRSNDYTEADFFRLVYATRYHDSLQTAAANAITLLNQAKISFSDMDLSHVKISGADLTGAICDHTDLSMADLTNVDLQKAFLRFTSFNHAKMESVNFGEFPSIKFDDEMHLLALSNDPNLLVTSSPFLEKVYLVNMQTSEQRELVTNNCVTSLCFSQDGKWLAVGMSGRGLYSDKDNRVLRVWETDNWNECNLYASNHGISSLIFSADNQILIGGDELSVLRIWRLTSNRNFALDKTIEPKVDDSRGINCLAISADQKYFVSGTMKAVKVRCISSLEVVFTISYEEDDQRSQLFKNSFCFSFDNRWLAIKLSGNKITIFNNQSFNVFTTCNLKIFSEIQGIAFSPNNNWLVASEYLGGNIHMLNTKSWQVTYILSHYSANNICFAISLDGQRLFSSSQKSIKIWDIRDQNIKQKKQTKLRAYTRMLWCDNLSFFLGIDDGGTVVDCLAKEDGTLIRELPHNYPIMSINISHNDMWVAIIDNKNNICVYDLVKWQLLKREQMKSDKEASQLLNGISFSSDDHWLIAIVNEELYYIKVWRFSSNKTEKWKSYNIFSSRHAIETLCVSTIGFLIVFQENLSDKDNKLHVYDMSSMPQIAKSGEFVFESNVHIVRLSQNNARLAMITDKKIIIYDTISWNEVACIAFEGHNIWYGDFFLNETLLLLTLAKDDMWVAIAETDINTVIYDISQNSIIELFRKSIANGVANIIHNKKANMNFLVLPDDGGLKYWRSRHNSESLQFVLHSRTHNKFYVEAVDLPQQEDISVQNFQLLTESSQINMKSLQPITEKNSKKTKLKKEWRSSFRTIFTLLQTYNDDMNANTEAVDSEKNFEAQITLKIFSYLDNETLKSTVSLVCRNWHRYTLFIHGNRSSINETIPSSQPRFCK